MGKKKILFEKTELKAGRYKEADFDPDVVLQGRVVTGIVNRVLDKVKEKNPEYGVAQVIVDMTVKAIIFIPEEKKPAEKKAEVQNNG